MILIKFSATWCGPCKVMHDVLEDVFTEHPEYRKDTNFTEIDVDDDINDLSGQYGVTNIPALVAVSNEGKRLDSIVGTHTKEDVIQFIEHYKNL